MGKDLVEISGNEVLNLIAESLKPGRRDILRDLFIQNGARPPVILWSPEDEELRSPLMRRFAEAIRGWERPDGRIRERDFDPSALGTLSDWFMQISVEVGIMRYDYYGDGIRRHYGKDMTGAEVTAFGGHIAQFFIGVYEASRDRKERVMTIHEPPRAVFVRAWRRLIVPLFADDGETVTSFAVLNTPENELRAGLELIPDPVFVAGADQTVVYANEAAVAMFDLPPITGPGASLRTLTGIEIENSASPEDLLAGHQVDDSLQLALRGGIAERLDMTVTAVEHRGTAFYLIILRQVTS